MDLRQPEYSYMMGFLHADGHLGAGTGNRGKLSVEIQAEDVDILRRFKSMTPCPSSIIDRHRSTNFKANSQTSVWCVSSLPCRQALVAAGMPIGAKGKTVAVPSVDFVEVDYFRGYLDGNGSLGLTGTGVPFLSFGTGSAELAGSIVSFIESIIDKTKTAKPNRRDGYFNLMVTKEDAVAIARKLYYPNALALARKARHAEEVIAWVRPAAMRKCGPRANWTADEDRVVLAHSISDAAQRLGRSAKSVASRRFRLRSGT